MSTFAGLAGLEDHHEGVKSSYDGFEASTADGVGGGRLGVGEVVMDLAGVELVTRVSL